MDGRLPRGIRYVLTRCQDPSKEPAFNRWYNGVHIPDILAVGALKDPTRYRLLSHTSEGNPAGEALSRGRFLAIYETDREDVEGAVQEALSHLPRLQAAGRISPLLEVVWGQVFRSLGQCGRPAGRRTTGILVAFTNCKDPAGEAEFNRWYDTVHLPHVVGTGLYHTAYRFKVCTPKAGDPTYLAIYETDGADPAEVERELVTRHRPGWQRAGQFSPYLEVVWRGSFQRVYPPAA